MVEAVRRGEVPEAVLRRLRAILHGRDDATADLPRFASVWEIADFAGIPPEQAVAVFRALQQLPGVAPERLARRIAKAWLELQRQRHRPASRPGESG